MTQRHDVSKCCWKYGADRLVRCRVSINLQYVKNAIPAHFRRPRYASAIFSALVGDTVETKPWPSWSLSDNIILCVTHTRALTVFDDGCWVLREQNKGQQ